MSPKDTSPLQRAACAVALALAAAVTPASAAPGDGRCDAPAFAGGDGSAASPFRVHAASALDEVRDCLDSHFQQAAAIDLSSYPNWKPIGALLEGQSSRDPRAPRATRRSSAAPGRLCS